jgi:hypothetical protein
MGLFGNKNKKYTVIAISSYQEVAYDEDFPSLEEAEAQVELIKTKIKEGLIEEVKSNFFLNWASIAAIEIHG